MSPAAAASESGFWQSPVVGQELAQVAVRAHVVRLEVDGRLEGPLRLRMPPLPVQRDPEPPVQGRMVGTNRERLAIGRLGLGVPTLAPQAEGDVGTRADVIGLHPDRLPQRALGLGVTPLAAEGDAQVVVKIAVVGP